MATALWKTPAQRERERALKREAVLRAAAGAFSEQGFHRTSLDDVAERLNVTKPTIYHYVRSKDEILFECVRIGLERLDAAAASAEARRSGGSGLDRLIVLWTEYAHIVTEDFGRCLILVGEDPLPAETRKELRALKGKIDKRFRGLIEAGIADGSIRPCDPGCSPSRPRGAELDRALARPGGAALGRSHRARDDRAFRRRHRGDDVRCR